MPENTSRVLLRPALILSKMARKTIRLPLHLLAQLLELRRRNRTGAHAAPPRPVAVAAAADGQPQARRPRPQLERPAAPHVRVFRLDGAEAEGAPFRQRRLSAI